MGFPVAAAISGGLGLLNFLGGRSAAREQNKLRAQEAAQLRKDWEFRYKTFMAQRDEALRKRGDWFKTSFGPMIQALAKAKGIELPELSYTGPGMSAMVDPGMPGQPSTPGAVGPSFAQGLAQAGQGFMTGLAADRTNRETDQFMSAMQNASRGGGGGGGFSQPWQAPALGSTFFTEPDR